MAKCSCCGPAFWSSSAARAPSINWSDRPPLFAATGPGLKTRPSAFIIISKLRNRPTTTVSQMHSDESTCWPTSSDGVQQDNDGSRWLREMETIDWETTTVKLSLFDTLFSRDDHLFFLLLLANLRRVVV